MFARGTFSLSYEFEQVLRAVKLLEGEKKIRFVLQGGGEMAPVIRDRINDFILNGFKC